MTTAAFRHDGAGTPATAWHACPEWDGVPDVDLGAWRRLVVVAAHPDDESLGAGGLLARASALGLPVEIVVATAGEHSHPHSRTVTPEQLRTRRRAESEEAARAVAPHARLHHLDLGDGRLADRVPELTAALADLVGDGRSTVLVAPWRRDGHPDHDAAGTAGSTAAVRTGARLLEYPIWSWHWRAAGDLPWRDLRRLRLSEGERAAKQRAIAAHHSQVEPLSPDPGDEPVVPEHVLAHFAGGEEILIEQPAVDTALDDLHRREPEPWHVDDRWFEQRKRDVLLALLPRRRYRRAWEAGCSTGALAVRLADRADRVVGTDSSPTAAAAAWRRVVEAGLDDRVRLEVADISAPRDDGPFDLVVLSEAGYFLSPPALDRLIDVVADVAPDADVVLCHWRHPIDGWPLDADAVHARFREVLSREAVAEYLDRDVAMVVLGGPGSLPEADR